MSSHATRPTPWTQEEFFAWAATQEIRYEFDGEQPVAMTGGDAGHALVMRGLHRSLDARLPLGHPFQPLGPEAGVEIVSGTQRPIRYPDALVTCSPFNLSDKTIPGVVIVFEVLSQTSSRRDRIVKVREYATVSSIRRYIILESSSIVLTVMERIDPTETWRTTVLTSGDVLRIPEIGIEVPVDEIYIGIPFQNQDDT